MTPLSNNPRELYNALLSAAAGDEAYWADDGALEALLLSAANAIGEEQCTAPVGWILAVLAAMLTTAAVAAMILLN